MMVTDDWLTSPSFVAGFLLSPSMAMEPFWSVRSVTPPVSLPSGWMRSAATPFFRVLVWK